MYKSITRSRGGYYDETPDSDIILRKVLKNELATREHVIQKNQAKLIRQMSIHAGEKLTLKEAQKLSNQLKNKK